MTSRPLGRSCPIGRFEQLGLTAGFECFKEKGARAVLAARRTERLQALPEEMGELYEKHAISGDSLAQAVAFATDQPERWT